MYDVHVYMQVIRKDVMIPFNGIHPLNLQMTAVSQPQVSHKKQSCRRR